MIIHDKPDVVYEEGRRGKRVKTFLVGQDVERGEKLQWVVEGWKYKASFLLLDEEGGEGSEGLLISKMVVLGFKYYDYDFLMEEGLKWLLRRG